jgi:two-component system NarL family response regulator
LAEAERTRPDVVVLDAVLPNTDGIQTTYLLRERVPECRILVLGDEEGNSETLMSALEAGATGYLTRDAPLSNLIEGTRAVHRGETLIPPRMLGPLLAGLIRRRREQASAIRRIGLLTRREREVLALLADGAGNDSIAQSLVISPETARTHIQNVLAKLGVHSRLEAAAFVVQNGLMYELAGAAS